MGKLSDILGNKEDLGMGEDKPKMKMSAIMHPDMEDSADEGEEAGKVDAGRAVMKALKSGDAEAFSEALSDFIDMC